MATLGIKGHPIRGREVIQLLEMLGGVNYFALEGTQTDGFYYVSKDNNKIYHCLSINLEYGIIYTLEEFEEKFPYKVGDKVIVWIDGCRSICNIQNMEWDSIANEIKYKIQDYWYSTINLQPYIEELTMKNKSKLINIEPKLVGNECVHFPIPTGMKLEVKDGMCYLYRDCGEHKESKCLQELKEYLDNATPEQLEEDWKELEKFSEVGPVADEYIKHYKREGVNLQKMERKLDEALEKETTESLNKWLDEEPEPEPKAPILSNRYDYAEGKCGYVIPDGYEFDSIKEGFQTEIILKPKKPQYPKNYEECCKVLGFRLGDNIDNLEGYKSNLLEHLQGLLICRDAYWKFVGKEMGLDKPWKPDWESETEQKYTIVTDANEICNGLTIQCNAILAFPIKEMRDAFYENFKSLIEECKELL